jgi:hypothetical protein
MTDVWFAQLHLEASYLTLILDEVDLSGTNFPTSTWQVVKSGDSSVACICHEPATLSGKITCMIINAPRECIPTMQESDYQASLLARTLLGALRPLEAGKWPMQQGRKSTHSICCINGEF